MKNAISINLKRFRKMKGMTQEEVAEMAGISRNAYRSIETGRSMPRGRNLSGIASALDISVFKLTEEVPELKSLRFRTRKRLTSRQSAERDYITATVAVWLKNYDELEDLTNERRKYIFEADDLRGVEPREAASRTRELLDLGPGECITDICELLDEAGIKILELDSKLDRFFGLSVGPEDGGPAIGVNVNEDITVERQIFTTAHELAHLLLHSGSFDKNEISEDRDQEQEADIFASHFLMPNERFVELWSDYRGMKWTESVLRIKRLFRVSYKTVLHRLIENDLAEREIYQKFYSSYKRDTGRELTFREEPDPYGSIHTEPLTLESTDFSAYQLNRLVRDALENKHITMSRAAEILGISVSQMKDEVEEWGVVNARPGD